MQAPELNIVDTGEGPPVLLLHGLTATNRYVVMGSTALQRAGHRVIAYDARGHGRSAAADVYDYPGLQADLVRVMDGLGIERAVLAGASMGAHTLLGLALREPDRVAGLIAITPAYHDDADPDLGVWDRRAAGLRERGIEGFIDAYGGPIVDDAFRETVLRVIRQRMSLHDDLGAIADALEQVPRSKPFAVADLAGLEGFPVTVVADRDQADPSHPLWVGEAYAEAIPGAQLVVEEEGKSPLAWQGGRLSRVIADVAARGRW